jgi:hypothetical protein
VRPRVVVSLTAAELDRERANLERGSVVGTGVTGLERGAWCDLELVFPTGPRMLVPARAVLVSEAGTVFAFEAFDREALGRHLAEAWPATPEVPAPPAAPVDEEAAPEDAPPANVQERLRGLSVAEQLRVARSSSLTERVTLERLYGKTVWEALLRNPHLTVPEVARLARLGTMPRPLLELIVGNPAWLQVPLVRRALLSNPRLSPDMVHKVLVLLPRDELQLVPRITAYPAAVRLAARGLVKR